mgnify:CR=1 FL=1
MEKVEIKKLIEQCLNYFYESGYAKGTIDYYKCLWTKGILQYMSDKGIDMYTPDVGAKFIESTQHQDMSNHECERIRSIHALNDIMTVGYIRKQCVRAAFYPLDGAIGKQMEKLVLHLISLRRGKNTLKHYRSCLGNFFVLLRYDWSTKYKADNRGTCYTVSFFPTAKQGKDFVYYSMPLSFLETREHYRWTI